MSTKDNTEFMTAIQNLVIKALEQIFANGVSFTIMVLFCGLMFWHNREQKEDCSLAISEVQTEVKGLKEAVQICNNDRLSLSVKIAAMEVLLDKKKNK
jgi:hypothetical protein